MITIQAAMLVALGFLAAVLLALLVAPAFWNRAVRLTTRRLKDSMPLSEVEIRADKDRLRAEYAIRVHRLESQMEQIRLAGARQQIELNRRDASINELEGQVERLTATLEEAQNARRVLEQTVADRLPRVETRLSDARKMLVARDREIGDLTRTAEKQRRALEEAAAINAQQQSEIERLGTSLTTRAARNQEGLSDPRFEGEVALRAELESLRAKTRDQAQLLSRLQAQVGRPVTGRSEAQAIAQREPAAAGAGTATSRSEDDIAALAAAERHLRTLKSRTDDQAAEITRLKAALAVFEAEEDGQGKPSLRESRIALKAKLQSLEAQAAQHTDTIQKLRAELAAANERIGRQAAHFTSELRRLGAGTLPASGEARRPAAAPARLSLAERVSRARGQPATPLPTERAPAPEAAAVAKLAAVHQAAAESLAQAPAAVEAQPDAAPREPVPEEKSPTRQEVAAMTAEKAEAASRPPAEEGARRTRLLDRIAGIGRPS